MIKNNNNLTFWQSIEVHIIWYMFNFEKYERYLILLDTFYTPQEAYNRIK